MMTSDDQNMSSGVVVHLTESDPNKQENVLRNIMNLLNEIDPATPVELVVHGPGIAVALAATPLAEKVEELIKTGANVSACANTLRAQSLSVEQLIKGVDVVPSGIAQVVRRQWQGWAYVRP